VSKADCPSAAKAAPGLLPKDSRTPDYEMAHHRLAEGKAKWYNVHDQQPAKASWRNSQPKALTRVVRTPNQNTIPQ
jgi:hypothetical protein